MAKYASTYMKPLVDKNFKGTLADPSKHSVFNIVFFGYTEISNTFNALKLSETLVSVAPPRSKKIIKDEYLKYIINTYLQDVYILKERLNAYATKLKRLLNKAGKKSLSVKHIDPLFKLIKSSLNGITNSRSQHVHMLRYSDTGLDAVSQMEIISRFNPEFETDYKFSYKLAQNIWSSRMKKNNKATKQLLDIYFDAISVAISKNGIISIP